MLGDQLIHRLLFIVYLPPRLSDMSVMTLWDYTQAAMRACSGVAAAPRGVKWIYFTEVVQNAVHVGHVWRRVVLALREAPDDEVKAAARDRRMDGVSCWLLAAGRGRHAAAVLLFTCCDGAAAALTLSVTDTQPHQQLCDGKKD